MKKLIILLMLLGTVHFAQAFRTIKNQTEDSLKITVPAMPEYGFDEASELIVLPDNQTGYEQTIPNASFTVENEAAGGPSLNVTKEQLITTFGGDESSPSTIIITKQGNQYIITKG